MCGLKILFLNSKNCSLGSLLHWENITPLGDKIPWRPASVRPSLNQTFADGNYWQWYNFLNSKSLSEDTEDVPKYVLLFKINWPNLIRPRSFNHVVQRRVLTCKQNWHVHWSKWATHPGDPICLPYVTVLQLASEGHWLFLGLGSLLYTLNWLDYTFCETLLDLKAWACSETVMMLIGIWYYFSINTDLNLPSPLCQKSLSYVSDLWT